MASKDWIFKKISKNWLFMKCLLDGQVSERPLLHRSDDGNGGAGSGN